MTAPIVIPDGWKRDELIACIEREVRLRERAYPRWIQQGRMTTEKATAEKTRNGALQHRRDAWRRQRVNVTLYGQQKELTELRASDPEWAAIPAWVERSALVRLDRAFKASEVCLGL